MSEPRRWMNQSQPQTLVIATFLLYANGVLLALFGGLFSPIGLLFVAAYVGGGFGIANEKKWGYALGIAVAVIVLLFALAGGLSAAGLLSVMFDVALVALLLHPQSREYQRIWFR